MVSANKEEKKRLLKIIDALDLAVNRAEANLEKVENHRDEILEYLEAGKEEKKDERIEEPEAPVKVKKRSKATQRMSPARISCKVSAQNAQWNVPIGFGQQGFGRK